ncbi:hypothetical protein RE0356_29890 [Prescottella equi]|nr:hypothetical protein RE0356_29890 [Prescottella equi]
MSDQPAYDPERWPLAPGNASPDYEELSARIKEQWRIPLDEAQLAVIRGAFSRATPTGRDLTGDPDLNPQ